MIAAAHGSVWILLCSVQDFTSHWKQWVKLPLPWTSHWTICWKQNSGSLQLYGINIKSYWGAGKKTVKLKAWNIIWKVLAWHYYINKHYLVLKFSFFKTTALFTVTTPFQSFKFVSVQCISLFSRFSTLLIVIWKLVHTFHRFALTFASLWIMWFLSVLSLSSDLKLRNRFYELDPGGRDYLLLTYSIELNSVALEVKISAATSVSSNTIEKAHTMWFSFNR